MQLHDSFLSFQSGSSFLHDADPRIKLACLITWELMIWYTDLHGALLLLGTTLLLYALCRVSLLRAYATMKIVLLLACTIIAIPFSIALYRHGFTTPLQIELFTTPLRPSVHYALRLCTIALVAHLFTATTTTGRWVDALEWLLLPWSRLRGALGLMTLVALNYVVIIQQYHHQLLLGLRARQCSKRPHFRATLQYCLSLIIMCARFVTLTTLAISTRQFRYTRTPPAFSIAIRPTITLLLVTLMNIALVLYAIK